ncbi:MAG: hypothetical protein ACMXYA_01635 [Candidatus Woesearchaeota archaeon]
MSSKSFHKDLDEYLAKKSSHSVKPSACSIKNPSVFTRFRCWIELVFQKIRSVPQRIRDFFRSTDNVDLQKLDSSVVVVESSKSPASQFFKKLFGSRSSKQTESETSDTEDIDIDPKLIEKTIRDAKK